MSEPEGQPPLPPAEEDRFTLDDLVAHEKQQMRFVLLVMVLAGIYFAGRQFFGGGTPEAAPEFRPAAELRGPLSGE